MVLHGIEQWEVGGIVHLTLTQSVAKSREIDGLNKV